MKKILLIIIGIVLNYSSVIAQVPNSFRYQAVVRNSAGELVSNKLVTLKISILQGSALGASVYSEVFEYVTNEYGIVAVNIGSGVTLQGIFGSINWGSSSYYLQVEIDLDGGENYTFMGASQILAVPYAMYALNVENTDDADANPNNELQTISKSGNLVTLSNSGGSFIDEINDADADPTNEIQDLILSDNVLRITNNANATAVNLAAYQGVNTDEQTLSTNIIGNTVQLTIEGGTGGNTVSFQLPSDFVSRSSGGTFIGPIYASNLSGTNTGDMSNADVVSAYNTGFPDHFTSTDRVKLNGIEANATSDMTNTEIVTAYQTGYPGYFNGADRSKLNSIETGATADMTNAEIVTAYNTGFADHFTSTDRIELNRLSLINNFTVSGGFSLQFVTQGNTSFTLPAANGTLATESFVTSNSLPRSLNTGRIFVGDGGVANELDARGSGFLLVGNGSTLVSSAITGDVSISHNAGITSSTVNSIGGNPVTPGMVNNWNAAYNWGNHATEGYLTSVTGVSSIAGTTNQIVASGSVGSVTLSLPSAITGLTSVTATTFNGNLNGNAATASSVAASDLTGTALASNVVTSSLTAVGNITSGTWSAGAINSTSTITGTTITGTTIVKTGGGATEFLKADGSVDGNTYLTSSSAVTSILGTTNQITVSASTGAVTLSLPSTITGLTSISSTGFTGALNGNATTASTLQTGRTISITGDITYTSPSFNGSSDITAGATLATVNTNVGEFGSASLIPTISVNGKGLVTAVSTSAVIAPAGTLTGTTLASNVITSSLTTVGNITSGTWSAGAINSTGAITGTTITGTTIVRSGGQATEFLKADGSVDSNTYLTAINEFADEFTATALQTDFTLSNTPSVNSVVRMYVDGFRVSNALYSVVGTAVTYSGATLSGSEIVQFDYYY